MTRAAAIGWGAALFVLNALVCRELFTIEYTKFLGSIEAAYIGISRYAIEHPFEWGWFPLWYTGVPYENTYPPLLHLIVAAVAWLGGISPALAHHAVTATFYAAGPVTLFAMLLALSRRLYPSLLAALVYSLVSPAPVLVSGLRNWAGPGYEPARLQALLEFGDGPHIAAVTLLPLAVWALHRALERPRPGRTFLAATALASVVLTNWLGAFSLAIMAVSYLLARSNEQGWGRLVLRSASIAAIAYGLALPGIPPSNIADIRHNAQYTIGYFPMTARHLAYGAIIIVIAGVMWRFFRRWETTRVIVFGCYLTLFFSALVLTDDLWGLKLMPQPHRYHHELEMAVCLLGVFVLARLTNRLPGRWEAFVATASAVLLTVVQYGNYREKARIILRPIDMAETFDYEASVWLGEHLPDDRVFLSGSVQFWLNAFADTPQVGGGFGQGIVNRTIPALHFGVPFTEGDGERTAMWLRLYGAQAVAVSGPGGRDRYHEVWRDSNKFDGVLPEIWRQGEDVIYRVPQRSRSIAHVILPEHVPHRSPVNNLDTLPVEPLARALEDPALPTASLEWINPSNIAIDAELEVDHLLFIQVAHHAGWRAFVDEQPLRIRKDALGFMIVEPRCEGPCRITLSFGAGHEMLLSRLICGLTIVGGLFWGVVSRRIARKRSPRTPAVP